VKRSTLGQAHDSQLVFVQIFAGNVVCGHLAGTNFLPLAISGVFDPGYDSGFESISFLQQLVDTLGIDGFRPG
jgi:hypothetical protein